ncbi:hypothetical protein MMC07_000468 [Pseudocyphellaria aurata]|nr:hypothetical protein [Pseudocyphellaria aurata]
MDSRSSMESLDFATLDVFTDIHFKGNPLAIVHLPKSFNPDQELKQAIAREFNLSETVFLHEAEESSTDRKIDIFTKVSELPFAGHPTIGAICHIAAQGLAAPHSIGHDSAQGRAAPHSLHFTLHTKAGPIAASYDYEKRSATARIPHDINIHKSEVHWKYILDAQPSLIHGHEDKGQRVLEAWNRRADGSEASFPIVSIVNGMNFVLIDFPRLDDYLEKLRSDFGAVDPNVTILDQGWSADIIAPYYYVVLRGQDDGIERIRTRLILPMVEEDPATGSAASALTSYLSLQKGGAGQTYTYRVEQGVEMGRSSHIGVKVTLDGSGKAVKQVLLSGTAVSVLQGTVAVKPRER